MYAERPKLHMRMRRTKLLGYNAATDASEALRVNLQREGYLIAKLQVFILAAAVAAPGRSTGGRLSVLHKLVLLGKQAGHAGGSSPPPPPPPNRQIMTRWAGRWQGGKIVGELSCGSRFCFHNLFLFAKLGHPFTVAWLCRPGRGAAARARGGGGGGGGRIYNGKAFTLKYCIVILSEQQDRSTP